MVAIDLSGPEAALLGAQCTVFAAALFTLITGVIVMFDILSNSNFCDPNVQDCVGSMLISPPDNFADDVNTLYRLIFNLDPNVLFTVWLPVIIGLMSTYVHFFQDAFWMPIFQSWLTTCFWYLFTALFANFGYAGNFGILTGFVSSLAALVSLLIHFSGNHGSGPFLPIATSLYCSGKTLPHSVYVAGLLTMVGIASALLTFILGIMHVVRKFPQACEPNPNVDPPVECVGPGLFWNPAGERFVADSNGGPFFFQSNQQVWANTVFSLAPLLFFDNFAPFFLGLVGVLATIPEADYFASFKASYGRILFWHVFVAVYGNFGYEGLFGIIIGFISISAALIALLLTFTTQECLFGANAFGRGLSVNCVTKKSRNQPADDAKNVEENDSVEVEAKPEKELDDYEAEADVEAQDSDED